MVQYRSKSKNQLAALVIVALLLGVISLGSLTPLPASAAGPTVLAHPEPQFSATGGSVTFSVQFSEPGIIQWEFSDDGSNWQNEVAAKSNLSDDTLTLAAVTVALDGRQYRAVLNPGSSQLESDPAVLRVSESQLHHFHYGFSHLEYELGKTVTFMLNGDTTSQLTAYVCYAWEVDGVLRGLTPGGTSWKGGTTPLPILQFGPGIYEAVLWTNRNPATGEPINAAPVETPQNPQCSNLVAAYDPDIRSNPIELLPQGALTPNTQTLNVTRGQVISPTTPLTPNSTLPAELTPVFRASPALPDGLTLDSANGVISGTPSAALETTTISIIAESRARNVNKIDVTTDPVTVLTQESTTRIMWNATASITITVSEPVSPPPAPAPTPSSSPSKEREKNPAVAVEMSPIMTTPTFPSAPQASQRPDTSPVRQPVQQPGTTFNPNTPTSGTVGGQQAGLEVKSETAERLAVRAGDFQFGVSLRPGAGEIRTDTLSRSPELFVPRGQSAALQGAGSFPGSFVQVWLAGSDSRELARIPVGPDGTFSSSFSLSPGSLDMPVPIGRQVLQVVGYDEAGNQTVVDMTINIGQGVPAPEPNREAGALPALAFGQSLATSGGIPERVSLTGLPDTGTVAVEGDGWLISVTASRDNGVVENSDGNVLVRLNQSSVGLTEGRGFLPGTLATVWLFSDPTLVSTVTVDEDGQFAAEFLVDARLIAPGEHTLQVQGVGHDGYIKAANLGVLVEQPAAVTSESASSMLFWILGLVLLALVIVFWFVIARRRRNQEV